MMVKKNFTWLLLLVRLPATHTAERVAIWRKLKKSGAIQIQTSTYILPDEPARYETFQWLTQHIRDAGGDATLIRAQKIEGLSNQKLIELFNAARAKEYAALIEMIRSLDDHGQRSSSFGDKLGRLRKQFREIRQSDFFDSPKAQNVEVLLRKLEQIPPRARPQARIDRRDFLGRIWLTRPHPEIDRVGSAWLIRKFIDPKAKFIFGAKRPPGQRVITFDMLEGDFSHDGDDCTFETLIRRFEIKDKAARKIAEMIHDADLDDDKFQRSECFGIDRVLKGWAKQGLPDKEILRRGFECFDALYAFLQRR
ncbi:MAG TPA: chromate resistance protein ChrB domain-containing protein [Candidatus Udaeobacter sp.]|nr:chromate resistance protein ChrB domain-containing protein [Candidatus Udaeobacter sp.]